MSHIPTEAIWYVAEIIEEIVVEDDLRNVVHRNWVLIGATSPEMAYERAVSIGKESQISYENPAGKKVQTVFRGLGELTVVHDDLEHGAELLYQENVGVPREQLEAWIHPKEQLSVFRPCEPSAGPDYSAKDIMDEAQRLMTNSSQK